MTTMEQIELEIQTYLASEKNLSSQDRLIHLMAIFSKHFAMEKTEHLMTIQDLRSIIDIAKGDYTRTQLPMKISKKEVFASEVPNYLMVEATIAHLNRAGVLRKLAKFDK